MKVENVPTKKLVADPRNARQHNDRNLEAIKRSLAKFGQQKPIVIDKSGKVIAGNGTLAAAQALGWTHIAAVRTDLIGTQAAAYAIADNRTAELAEWDEKILGELLAEIQQAEASAVLDTGFDEAEIDRLIKQLDEENNQPEEPPVPQPPTKAVTRPGDIIIMGRHRLVCGDCTDDRNWDALEIEPNAVAFTSPPYGAAKSAKLRDRYVRGRKQRKSFYAKHDDDPSNWLNLMRDWTSSALARCGVVVCNVQLLADNKRHMIHWLADHADHLVDVVVWDKGNGPPQMQANVLNNAWEFVFILSRESEASRSIPLASFHGTESNIVRVNPRGNEFCDVHRAVMPVGLAEWAINLFNAASMFVDPFGGTGTTLIAAENHDRPARLIEIEPSYCDVAVQRWQDLTGQKAKRLKGR